MSETKTRWVIDGEDPELEGYRIVTDDASQEHDGDGAGECVATVYDLSNALQIIANQHCAAGPWVDASIEPEEGDYLTVRWIYGQPVYKVRHYYAEEDLWMTGWRDWTPDKYAPINLPGDA